MSIARMPVNLIGAVPTAISLVQVTFRIGDAPLAGSDSILIFPRVAVSLMTSAELVIVMLVVKNFNGEANDLSLGLTLTR